MGLLQDQVIKKYKIRLTLTLLTGRACFLGLASTRPVIAVVDPGCSVSLPIPSLTKEERAACRQSSGDRWDPTFLKRQDSPAGLEDEIGPLTLSNQRANLFAAWVTAF